MPNSPPSLGPQIPCVAPDLKRIPKDQKLWQEPILGHVASASA